MNKYEDVHTYILLLPPHPHPHHQNHPHHNEQRFCHGFGPINILQAHI